MSGKGPATRPSALRKPGSTSGSSASSKPHVIQPKLKQNQKKKQLGADLKNLRAPSRKRSREDTDTSSKASSKKPKVEEKKEKGKESSKAKEKKDSKDKKKKKEKKDQKDQKEGSKTKDEKK